MEGNAEVFIDPEEDEVFFYGMTEREYAVKCFLENKMQVETKNINENCLSHNNHAFEDVEGKIQSMNGLRAEEIADLQLSNNTPDLLSVPFDRNSPSHENIADNLLDPVAVTYQENLTTQVTKEDIVSPKKQNAPEKKKLDQRNGVPSMVNVYIDHSYSIPMKNVIDKSILKTPKSMVKADKDGGFLKVLSEIALVKAEADENNLADLKKLTDTSAGKELSDDDKENKSDTENANVIITPGDLSPSKVHHSLTVSSESHKSSPCSFEELNEEHLDLSPISELGSESIAETMKVQFLGDEREFEIINTEIVINDPIDELCLVKSLSLQEERSNIPKLASEKLDDNLVNDEVMKEKETTEEMSDSPILTEFDDNFKDNLYEESNILEEDEELEGFGGFENDFSEEESDINLASELNLPAADVDMRNEGKNDSLSVIDISSSQRERHNKFLRRNTMRLLEELNELVTFGQANRESLGTVNAKLSEEAAKVIQNLKAVGFDDSICSPEQYFDLDKLDSSVFNSEVSDVLNDTLSKPLSHITSKDVESLLEKITENSLEVENEITLGFEFNSRKDGSNNADEISENEDYRLEDGMSTQSENNRKLTGESNALTGSEFKAQKSLLLPPQTMQAKPKEFRSADKKCRTVTRIPKLISTTTKVPVTEKEVKQQLGYPTPMKTPFLRAQKSLKFNNIDSTVSTNANSKMPVTFSTGKGKAATKGDTKMKSVNNKSSTRNLFPKSETKFNSQFHKYKFVKETVSLKESSTESHLPKFVPKILKGSSGGKSGTSKYGGGVHRTIPKNP